MVKVSPSVKKKIPKQPRLSQKKFILRDKKNQEYFHLRITDEIFTNYEDYSYKLSLLSRPIWECELTGTTNLTYWQANELEQIIEALVIQRLPSTLRAEFLAPPLPENEGEKVRKAQLVASASQEYFSTFFPGEKARIRNPKTKGYKDGEIVCEVDISELPAAPEPSPEAENGTSAPFKAYRVKSGSEESYVVDASQIKCTGLLKHVRLLPLRLLFNKWAAGLPLGSDRRRAMKVLNHKAGIPTQAGLTVEVPIKSVSNLSQPSNEITLPLKRKTASFLGPASSVIIGGVAVSPGLLSVLNELTDSGLVYTNGGAPPLKQKKYDDIRKNAKEIQAKEEAQAKQKEIESAIKYPIEDLDVLPKLAFKKRPPPHAFPNQEGFDHIIKVWTFLSTFDGFLGVECVPLMKLRETFADACSGTTKGRFPLEHLITVLLELICTDADTVTNLYIPQGINDILQAPKGHSIQHIGDWRKATIPVPLDQWGCVLLGCIKELFCAETLPNGQSIVDHLEADVTAHPDSAIHLRLVEGNFTKAGAGLKSKSKAKAAPTKSSVSLRRSSRKKPKDSDDEEENESEEEDALHEEDPKKREKLEPLIQQQFYSLPVDDKIQLVDFLIEQSLGTTKFKSYHEETYDEISSLRKERSDLFKEVRGIQEQLGALKEEYKQMKDNYSALYEESPQQDPTDSTSSAEVPVRPLRHKSGLRKESTALSNAIQSKADSIQRLEISEMKLLKKADQGLKEIDESLSLLRFRHLGEDRFFTRYYFVPCTNGPLLVVEAAHPSLLAQLTVRPLPEVESYRAAIEGHKEPNDLSMWGFYSSASQIRDLLSSLCTFGVREKALKAAIEKVQEKFPVDPK